MTVSRRGLKWVLCVLGLTAVVGVCDLSLSSYWLYTVNTGLLLAFGAIALTVLVGRVGLTSMAHVALLAVGGASAAVAAALVSSWALPFGSLIAAIAGTIAGAVAGLAALRLSHFYLALSSLALSYVVLYIFQRVQFNSSHSETGYSASASNIGPWAITGERAWLILLAVLLVIVVVLTRNVLKGYTGRAWMGLRDREIVARAQGINVAREKIIAFAATSAIVSVSGTLSAFHTGTVSVDQYDLSMVFQYYAIIILGGLGSVVGAVVASVLFSVVQAELGNVLTSLPTSMPLSNELSLREGSVIDVLMGLLIVGVLLFSRGRSRSFVPWARTKISVVSTQRFRSYRNAGRCRRGIGST
jgi:branched-chain amino acid transport system permease protein